MLLFVGLALLIVANLANCEPPSSNAAFIGSISTVEKEKFRSIFSKSFEDPSKDPSKIYHAILGLHHLGAKFPDAQSICTWLKKPVTAVDYAFYISTASKLLGSSTCKVAAADIEKAVKGKLTDDVSAENLFYIVFSMNNVNIKVDSNQIVNVVNKLKSKDSNPNTMAYIFQILPQLGLSKSALNSYTADLISVLEKADELDGNQLYYERGVYTTALMAKSVIDYSNAIGEVPSGVEDKIVKLFNYLYTRRETTNLRALAYIVAAFDSLAKSPLLLPVAIENPTKSTMPKTITIDQSKPVLEVQLSHVWGGELSLAVGELELRAKGLYGGSMKHNQLGEILVGSAERGEFKHSQKSVFQLTFNSADIPASGYYHLMVVGRSKKPNDKRKLLGMNNSPIPLRVVTEMIVSDLSLTIMDKLQERHVADISIQAGKLYKSSSGESTIRLQSNQQFSLEFKTFDLFKNPMRLHQAFVQLTHQTTKQTITFICNELVKDKQTGSKVLSLYVDPDATAPDFDYLSGVYEANLILGDSLIKNPTNWHMFNIDLKFTGEPGSETKRRIDQAYDVSRQSTPSVAGAKRAASIVGTGPSGPKPEIEHLFRSPEKRAPTTLALVFTGLCLVPVLVLVIGWLGVGINLSNFKLRLSNILFHAGLIAICCLYYTYWIRLDMFTTIGYLVILSVPTFLAGNAVLRAVVAARLSISSGNQSNTTKKH